MKDSQGHEGISILRLYTLVLALAPSATTVPEAERSGRAGVVSLVFREFGD